MDTITLPQTRLFHRRVTVHRFVQAADPQTAARLGTRGVTPTFGTLTDPVAEIEYVAARRARICRYRHVGVKELWWVCIDVDAMIRAAGPDAATEVAHQLVIVAPTEAGSDAFEFEVQVWPQLREAC